MKLLISEGLTKALAPPVSPPIASSSLEEEERLELDYVDDSPAPRVDGTAQGDKSVSPSRLSKADPLGLDWDGTPSKYLTPHLTPKASLNVLVPLPSRWSGGYCLCILLITGYRFRTDNVYAFQDGQRRSGSQRVVSFLQGSYHWGQTPIYPPGMC